MPRPKGSPNKATATREAHYAKQGLMPLDFMLGVLRDEKAPKTERYKAAVDAAPYVHARLQSVQAKHEVNFRAWLLSLGEPD